MIKRKKFWLGTSHPLECIWLSFVCMFFFLVLNHSFGRHSVYGYSNFLYMKFSTHSYIVVVYRTQCNYGPSAKPTCAQSYSVWHHVHNLYILFFHIKMPWFWCFFPQSYFVVRTKQFFFCLVYHFILCIQCRKANNRQADKALYLF